MSSLHPDSAFDAIVADALQPFDTSPALEAPPFVGIRIDAPARARVRGRGEGRLVVSGACRFTYDYQGLAGRFTDSILFVAVNVATLEIRADYAAASHASRFPERDVAEEDDADTEGLLVGQWFNPELARGLALPHADATYIVYATLGEHVSNAVRIRVAAE
jgi:hypothetical protein